MRREAASQLRFALDTEGELIPLPLSMLMQTVFFGGYKGSGKTTSMKKLFEAAHEAGAQCVSVAPLGKWWSLRIAKNGKGKGLAGVVVFGGSYGDVPVQPGSGKLIARAVHSKRLHAVLDVELMRKDERAVFLADFFEELMLLRKGAGSRDAMVVFLDETQAVAPQKSSSREIERLRVLLGDFARECRNFGCGLVMSAQRSASVDKELIALCEMLVVMRTVHHLDRAVYKHWVSEKGTGGEDEEDGAWLKKLRRLEKGQAYLYAPELNIFERVSVLLPKTYDATATATIGQKVAHVGSLSRLDVKRLSAELGEMVEKAAAEDPKALRARVAELEADLARTKKWAEDGVKSYARDALKKPPVDWRAEKRASKALQEGFKLARLIEHLVEKLAGAGVTFAAHQPPSIVPSLTKLAAQLPAWKAANNGPPFEKKSGVVYLHGKVPAPAASHIVKMDAPNGLQPGAHVTVEVERENVVGKQKAMLAVLVNGSLTKRELAGAVAQARGGTFDAYVSRLKTWGYITEQNGVCSVTPKGQRFVMDNGSPLSMRAEAILQRNSSFVVGKMKDMVHFVGNNPGVTKQQIIEGVGQSPGGTADAYISRLVARALFMKDPHGRYSWTPMMERGR